MRSRRCCRDRRRSSPPGGCAWSWRRRRCDREARRPTPWSSRRSTLRSARLRASGAVEGVTLALEIQAAVADEVGDQRFDVKTALACALVPRIVEVLATSERVLEASVGGKIVPRRSQVRGAARGARVAQDGLGGGGGCVLSPGQLAQSRRGLVVGALEAMAAEDSAVADAARNFSSPSRSRARRKPHPRRKPRRSRAWFQGLLSHGERILARTRPGGHRGPGEERV